MKILILEDCQDRVSKFRQQLIGHEVTVTDQVLVCIEYLCSESYDVLFLDHDLGGRSFVPSGPGTGYEVACWLEKNKKRRPGQIIIHSLNPAGAENMLKALPGAVRIPFAWMYSMQPS